MDFRSADGDRIDLTATGLSWSGLDTNRNGVLDDGDRYVETSEEATSIDLGLAAGRSAAGLNVVTLVGVVGLAESDVLLA
jgi:hypothetical protein